MCEHRRSLPAPFVDRESELGRQDSERDIETRKGNAETRKQERAPLRKTGPGQRLGRLFYPPPPESETSKASLGRPILQQPMQTPPPSLARVAGQLWPRPALSPPCAQPVESSAQPTPRWTSRLGNAWKETPLGHQGRDLCESLNSRVLEFRIFHHALGHVWKETPLGHQD